MSGDADHPMGIDAEGDEIHNNARIRLELEHHTEKLKELVDVDCLKTKDLRVYHDAAEFMDRMGEDCEQKRIFICCDGTGKNASGTIDPLTNVAKLARAVDRFGYDKYTLPQRDAVQNHPLEADVRKRLWKSNAGYQPPQWALQSFVFQPEGGARIKVLAEWDTVSSLGLWGNSLSFVGNKVPENVDNAFLAVSLHEKRKKFSPMLWGSEENRGTKTNIKQCIFAGCHSDIGGGNPDPALSMASFFWMVGQIKDCGCQACFAHLATTFEPEVQGQVLGRTRWVKRGTTLKQFLEEDIMVDEEKDLLRKLLNQAQSFKNWSPDETLEDAGTYEKTFISLLEDTLEPHTYGPKSPDEAPIHDNPEMPSGPGSSDGNESGHKLESIDGIRSRDGANGSDKSGRNYGAESLDGAKSPDGGKSPKGVKSPDGAKREDRDGYIDKFERDEALRDLERRLRSLEHIHLRSQAPRRSRRVSAPV
ncbi:hypothetical protein PG993_009150 [Apiospora rasikravindrae]|uniref:T6SS Phospholipase effector Tle1-like catalytic domain-containing protein n=1 Tax=Apiospora rasikravindrae TaxID=990691 RepID=A0ABR1SIL1_9PEZI